MSLYRNRGVTRKTKIKTVRCVSNPPRSRSSFFPLPKSSISIRFHRQMVRLAAIKCPHVGRTEVGHNPGSQWEDVVNDKPIEI